MATLESSEIHAPGLVDLEFIQTARRWVRSRRCSDEYASAAVADFALLSITRHEIPALRSQIWALRPDLSAYDASYVALAQAIAAPLVTADARLAKTASRWVDVIGA
jgi:predicted nucleic acid-binding protein